MPAKQIYHGFDIEELGIGGHNRAAFTLYPNPTTDIVTISGNAAVTKVTVYNQLGQQVLFGQHCTGRPVGTKRRHLPCTGRI